VWLLQVLQEQALMPTFRAWCSAKKKPFTWLKMASPAVKEMV